jgi:hypothetical protein
VCPLYGAAAKFDVEGVDMLLFNDEGQIITLVQFDMQVRKGGGGTTVQGDCVCARICRTCLRCCCTAAGIVNASAKLVSAACGHSLFGGNGCTVVEEAVPVATPWLGSVRSDCLCTALLLCAAGLQPAAA